METFGLYYAGVWGILIIAIAIENAIERKRRNKK